MLIMIVMKRGNFFTKHLKEVGENYFEHFLFAFTIAWWILFGGLIHLIHSIFPFFFPRVTAKHIKKINAVMQRRCENRCENSKKNPAN